MRAAVVPVLLVCGVAVGAGCDGDGDGASVADELDLSKRPACFASGQRRKTAAAQRGRPGAERPRGAAGPAVRVQPSDDPVGACARRWRRGEVRVGATDAPPLKVCVGRGGRPHVLPQRRGNACRRVGLPDPRYAPIARRRGFRVEQVDNRDPRQVRRHSRLFCRAGVRHVARVLGSRPRRGAVAADARAQLSAADAARRPARLRGRPRRPLSSARAESNPRAMGRSMEWKQRGEGA